MSAPITRRPPSTAKRPDPELGLVDVEVGFEVDWVMDEELFTLALEETEPEVVATELD
jgi:hypothetical protein